MIKEGEKPLAMSDEKVERMDEDIWEETWTLGFKSLKRLNVIFLREHDGVGVPCVRYLIRYGYGPDTLIAILCRPNSESF